MAFQSTEWSSSLGAGQSFRSTEPSTIPIGKRHRTERNIEPRPSSFPKTGFDGTNNPLRQKRTSIWLFAGAPRGQAGLVLGHENYRRTVSSECGKRLRVQSSKEGRPGLVPFQLPHSRRMPANCKERRNNRRLPHVNPSRAGGAVWLLELFGVWVGGTSRICDGGRIADWNLLVSRTEKNRIISP